MYNYLFKKMQWITHFFKISYMYEKGTSLNYWEVQKMVKGGA